MRGFFILILLAVFKITGSQNTQVILNSNQYQARDTVFTYTVNKIPKGILLALPPLQQKIKHKQSFIIKNAWLYNNRLFMFVRQTSNKVRAPAADKCYQMMTDINGRTCAMAGCITGNGSGDCAALRNAVNKIPYSVKVFITL